MLTIKKLTVADAGILDYILKNMLDDDAEYPIETHRTKLLTDERTYIYAALEGELVVGFSLAYRFPSLYGTEDLAYLYDIEVEPMHRRKGIGRQLVQAILNQMKTDGVRELWLGTGTNNKEGQALFSATKGIKSSEVFHDFTFELND